MRLITTALSWLITVPLLILVAVVAIVSLAWSHAAIVLLILFAVCASWFEPKDDNETE